MARTNKPKPWERQRSRARRQDIREVKQRFLVVCEGHTEKNYFDAFKVKSARITLYAQGCDALTLVQDAMKMKGQWQDRYDQFWVVFDRDEGNNSAEQIRGAFKLAEKNGFQVAFSNQAFELWFLLHFQTVQAAMTATRLEKKLDKLLPRQRGGQKYSKTDPTHYETLLPKQTVALRRAEQLTPPATKLETTNPSTTVHHLVAELNKYL